MATVPCDECGAPISSDARACPRCYARPQRASPGSGRWLAAAGLCVLAVGGHALYDSPAEGERARAVVAIRRSGLGVTTASSDGLVIDSGIGEGVRVVHAASVIGCRRLGRLEIHGGVMDPDQLTREVRLHAQAGQWRANNIVVSPPSPWPGQVSVEMYDCPE
jgi:hypothetical protein